MRLRIHTFDFEMMGHTPVGKMPEVAFAVSFRSWRASHQRHRMHLQDMKKAKNRNRDIKVNGGYVPLHELKSYRTK